MQWLWTWPIAWQNGPINWTDRGQLTSDLFQIRLRSLLQEKGGLLLHAGGAFLSESQEEKGEIYGISAVAVQPA
jgi:hypothetical protein